MTNDNTQNQMLSWASTGSIVALIAVNSFFNFEQLGTNAFKFFMVLAFLNIFVAMVLRSFMLLKKFDVFSILFLVAASIGSFAVFWQKDMNFTMNTIYAISATMFIFTVSEIVQFFNKDFNEKKVALS